MRLKKNKIKWIKKNNKCKRIKKKKKIEQLKYEYKLSNDGILMSKLISNEIYIQCKDYYSIIHNKNIFLEKLWKLYN